MSPISIDILKTVREAGFEVKGVKSFTGMEGYGFNANLYHNGKKVASVIDNGNGGTFLYRWERKGAAEQRANVARRCLKDVIRDLPEIPFGFRDGSFTPDMDYVMSCLVEYKEQSLQCKRETLFIDDGTTYTIRAKYDARMKDHLTTKYPGCTILNEVFAEIEANT